MLPLYLSLIDDERSKSKFEQLYLQYRQTMLWTALNILHDQSLAEDAVHDAFLRILDHLENIFAMDCNKTRGFIVVIVRNIALDQLRKRKRLAETDLADYEDYLFDPQSNPEQILLEKESQQAILTSLHKVKQTYTDALALQVSYGFSTQEIADLLNISSENARVRLHRGRQQIIRYLKEDDQHDCGSKS
jgi:RNA polymerase sigma-70 factor (ECF subfamily)